ncbi:MAG: M42 family metallopeptidase [Clostridia bacterium]|nr:M42 family metallopeptidase [Clostridia bacterium]
MTDLLKRLCLLDGTSGDEGAVRELIISEIKDFCELKTDPLGNIIAFKKGKKPSAKRLMLDAHMDEVGLIITSVTHEGFLKFKTVGGIDTSALLFRCVRINRDITGVIGGKPIHLISAAERKKLPKCDSLYIDIGAQNREEALKSVCIGDCAIMESDFTLMGDKVISKALDDRIGCALLITLLKEESEFDFHASFSVQEEIGLRGAKTAAFGINPQCAIVLEATTAADIAGVAEENTVCKLGAGPAVSFMDRSTVYDRGFYNAALESGIDCQPKSAVAGGNNSGAVHLTREGVRTLAISVPCRYIHTACNMADIKDIENALKLCRFMLNGICGGEIE